MAERYNLKQQSDRSIRYQYEPGVYGGSYPESELGFMTDPEIREQKEHLSLWNKITSWFADDAKSAQQPDTPIARRLNDDPSK